MKDSNNNTTSSTKFTFELVAKQAQTLLTFGYLTMVGLGMLYTGQKFQEFDINIFQYATILYFLIAPFEDLLIFKISAVAVTIFAVGYKIDPWIETRFPRFYTFLYMGSNKVSWLKQYEAWSWPLTFFLLIFVYSLFYAEDAYQRVLASNDITVNYNEGISVKGKLIGKTDNVVFLLEQDQVKAIPLESISNIVLGKITLPASEDAAPDSLITAAEAPQPTTPATDSTSEKSVRDTANDPGE